MHVLNSWYLLMCRHFNLNTISLSSRFSLFLSVTVLDILTAGTVVLIIFFLFDIHYGSSQQQRTASGQAFYI